MSEVHLCPNKNAWEGDVEHEPINANGAEADEIAKSESGLWFLIVNYYEYCVRIDYCPYCGIRLE